MDDRSSTGSSSRRLLLAGRNGNVQSRCLQARFSAVTRTMQTSKGSRDSHFVSLVQAWLRDFSFAWKSKRPPEDPTS